VQIEGDADSPISRGRLCPKGSASEQLVNAAGRQLHVLYRAPRATEWQRLDLDIAHGLALALGKVTHLGLRELDVGDHLARQAGDELLNLGWRKPKIRRRPCIEFRGEIAHCRIAARANVGDDLLDRSTHLRIGVLRHSLADAVFQDLHWLTPV